MQDGYFPGIRRGERFTEEETAVLVREVRARKYAIYGRNNIPPKYSEAKKSWEEISEIVSKICGITRTTNQIRKKYNDVRRRSNRKNASFKSQTTRQRERNVGNAENNTHLTNPSDMSMGFGGLEIGLQAPLKEEPEDQPVLLNNETVPEQKAVLEEEPLQEQESDVERDDYSELQVSLQSEATSPPRSVCRSMAQPDEHALIDLQQSGFNMLERELVGVRQNISCLNTRLNRIEVLLRPIGHIADSLGRIATAVERLTSK